MDIFKLGSLLDEDEAIMYKVNPQKALPQLFLGIAVLASVVVWLLPGILTKSTLIIIILSFAAIPQFLIGIRIMRNFFKAVLAGKASQFVLTDKKVYIYNKKYKSYDYIYLKEITSWECIGLKEVSVKGSSAFIFFKKIIFNTSNKTFQASNLCGSDKDKIYRMLYDRLPGICKTPLLPTVFEKKVD